MPATLHGIPWGPGEVLVATTSGTRLLCPTEDLSLAPELALNGDLRSGIRLLLGTTPTAGMTFVDVGANVGLFTILAASRVGPGGRVFAYECNPELIGFLRRNIAMNWFDDRVRLVAKAAHRDEEERLFQVPRDQKMLGSLTRFDGLEAVAGELQEFQVSCERLDVGLAEVPYIDLLKIDVEGGEAAVLDGASGLLDDGKVGVIAMEYRESALREELREEMEKLLTRLNRERGSPSTYRATRAASRWMRCSPCSSTRSCSSSCRAHPPRPEHHSPRRRMLWKTEGRTDRWSPSLTPLG